MALIDELYRVFELHLHRLDSQNDNQAEFISAVAEDYWQKIQKSAHINPVHEIEIREDIESEVLDMLRKKTYGHFNLKTYRMKKSNS